MITMNCLGCGQIRDCDGAGYCDWCAGDPEIDPRADLDACEDCGEDSFDCVCDEN
ncbi:hypothetical protein M8C13_40375 [Crossiella sp. SN42]|uniref:hypothetical protein n=1 Tax=Crossiella sp. SN42 TaxID=2944808 RepID=UPI00207C667E|nr:hypothetical protein [Crossiella sp. SN42]MCO1582024.1 hypothetical protein [Crossiella sp. SN42]